MAQKDCNYYKTIREDKGSCFEAYAQLNETVSVKNDFQQCLECETGPLCSQFGYKLNYWTQIIVCLLLSSLGFFMWRNKKFKKHPYPMFAWTSLIEGAFFCSLFSNSYWCSNWLFDLYVWSFGIFPTV